MPSKQETFDKVLAHSRTMTKKSVGSFRRTDDGPLETICAYRSPDGLQCFAGCLIPDDQYVPEMETTVPMIHAGNKGTLTGECLLKLGYDLAFVRRLQNIHDHREMDRWEEGFEEVAKYTDGVTYTPRAA